LALRRAVGALNNARHLNARCDAELAKGIAQVGFDGLGAKEKFGSDLRIGLAVHDESRDLELALGERIDARSVWLARTRAPVN
jgi:hypothetical protein